MKPYLYSRISTLPRAWNILTRIQALQRMLGATVVVQGNYNNRNIGDNAIGMAIADRLSEMGVGIHLNGYIDSSSGKNLSFSKYDYHIIGGGGIIRDFPPGNLESKLMQINSTRLESVVMSVGFDGITTEKGEKLIKRLDKCRFITVRDEFSCEQMQRLLKNEIEVSACPAFLTKPKRTKLKKKKDIGVIGLNLRPFYTDDPNWGRYAYYPEKLDHIESRKRYHEYVTGTLMQNLRDLSTENEIIFIPFARDDIEFANDHLGDIKMKILPLRSPPETLSIIQNVDNMICMRYHSIIFSILAGKNPFIISYHNKTRELSKMLGGAQVVDFLNFEPIEIDFPKSDGNIDSVRSRMIQSALRNFEKFSEIYDDN